MRSGMSRCTRRRESNPQPRVRRGPCAPRWAGVVKSERNHRRSAVSPSGADPSAGADPDEQARGGARRDPPAGGRTVFTDRPLLGHARRPRRAAGHAGESVPAAVSPGDPPVPQPHLAMGGSPVPPPLRLCRWPTRQPGRGAPSPCATSPTAPTRPEGVVPRCAASRPRRVRRGPEPTWTCPSGLVNAQHAHLWGAARPVSRNPGRCNLAARDVVRCAANRHRRLSGTLHRRPEDVRPGARGVH